MSAGFEADRIETYSNYREKKTFTFIAISVKI